MKLNKLKNVEKSLRLIGLTTLRADLDVAFLPYPEYPISGLITKMIEMGATAILYTMSNPKI